MTATELSHLAPSSDCVPDAQLLTTAERRAQSAATVRVTSVLLLLMAVIWGVNYSVVKFGTQGLPALAFNGLRVLLAAVVLLAVAGIGRAPWPSRRTTLALLGLGVLGNGFYQVLFIEGIARTRAGTAALVFAGSPALIAIIGRLLRVERVSPRGWGGIALQILGMALVVVAGAAAAGAQSGGATLAGNVILLGASICWALFTVLLKRYTHDVDPLQLSALTMIGGAIPLGAVAAPTLAGVDWGRVSPGVWGAVAYSGIFALVLAYLFWYRGIKVVGPTRTAMFGNLQPIIALAVAWLWPTLREVPTVWQGAGAALIVSGLLLGRPRS